MGRRIVKFILSDDMNLERSSPELYFMELKGNFSTCYVPVELS